MNYDIELLFEFCKYLEFIEFQWRNLDGIIFWSYIDVYTCK
ncbi:hypothetical protein SLEP1_g22402 [Rubroshorea leprosula]|uniref:Uncharacterized protein n=1 Tax=Rubroshorea leprosula TaxID=152421 RepID=A0AAV5JEF2_9ROSI|nr:hypothetical protein SLEP1_g22402 [Rubroshorea leprosula]